MKLKTILLLAFVLMCAVQILVPASMIWNKEAILANGTEFKFRSAPIDPNDPFRGKYIVLSFDEREFEVDSVPQWHDQKYAYVHLGTDSAGFAKITGASMQPPAKEIDYLKTEFWINDYDEGKLTLNFDYPFERYYMDEFKAKPAEDAYWNANRDTAQVSYALVSIQSGEAVLKDVLINGVSVNELVSSQSDD